MSYDISLRDPITKEVLKSERPHQIRGGTYALGGTTDLWLSVSYNYSNHFNMALRSMEGIRIIYGMTGAESIPILKQAISKLGDDVDDDYWKPTEGNAKKALQGLLALAQIRPDGVWGGD